MSDVGPIEVDDLDSLASRSPRPPFERYRRGVSEMFAPPGEAPREREGLPPGYRMRADAHYVDELSAADPVGDRDALEPEPRVPPTWSVGSAQTDAAPAPAATDLALVELAAQLASVEAATALLANSPSALARAVAVELIRSGSWRAAWLLQGQTMLSGAAGGGTQVKRLGVVLAAVVERFAPESRLTGFTIEAVVPDWNLPIEVDEGALVAGLTGAVIATLGLVTKPAGAVITLMPGPIECSSISIDVAQDSDPLPSDMARWAFDVTRRDRPGGAVATIGAAVAQAAARRHGGDASLLPNEGGGTTLRLRLGRRS